MLLMPSGELDTKFSTCYSSEKVLNSKVEYYCNTNKEILLCVQSMQRKESTRTTRDNVRVVVPYTVDFGRVILRGG
jgi:hypothetical protein